VNRVLTGGRSGQRKPWAATVSKIDYRRGLKHLLRDLDRRRGVYFSSGYEYPGRYSRWDFGFACPPLQIVSYDRRAEFRPLNERGRLRCNPA
jgi:anthranilate synthase